jgi:hypothetical protein
LLTLSSHAVVPSTLSSNSPREWTSSGKATRSPPSRYRQFAAREVRASPTCRRPASSPSATRDASPSLPPTFCLTPASPGPVGCAKRPCLGSVELTLLVCSHDRQTSSPRPRHHLRQRRPHQGRLLLGFQRLTWRYHRQSRLPGRFRIAEGHPARHRHRHSFAQ